MAEETDEPLCRPQVTLTFKITFEKETAIRNPNHPAHDPHAAILICYPNPDKPFIIGPFGGHHKDKASFDKAMKERVYQRAVLALATGFVDMEFSQSIDASPFL